MSFEAATLVFHDPFVITYPDRFEDGEERLQAVGSTGGILVVAVSHTLRHEDEEGRYSDHLCTKGNAKGKTTL
jgi:uncharacterized DUF497 family protein